MPTHRVSEIEAKNKQKTRLKIEKKNDLMNNYIEQKLNAKEMRMEASVLFIILYCRIYGIVLEKKKMN